MSKGTMLILPGNHGKYPDEKNNTFDYANGALPEKAALNYAALRDYDGEVLHVAGDTDDQIEQSVRKFNAKNAVYTAIYGFSGGGYHVLHILQQLSAEALQRISLVVVLGAPPVYRVENKATGKFSFPLCDTDDKGKLSKGEKHNCSPSPSDFESTAFAAKFPKAGMIKWELVYWTNPSPLGHMFGPDWLFAQESKAHQTG